MYSTRIALLAGILIGLGVGVVDAQVFGTVHGTVVDPQSARLAGALITVKENGSAFAQQAATDANGEFLMNKIPAGSYTIAVDCDGFQPLHQLLIVRIGEVDELRLSMAIASTSSTVEVTSTLESVNVDAASASVAVSQQDIQRSPGADRTSSLAFITNFTPGAFVLHDHLHIRGGHQVNYLVDGVPVPNTNMSSNVGRAMDPKDIKSVEINRGGYSAEYGDRTFGVINIVTRSGFEFENEGELSASYGSENQTNDQLSFGGHGQKLAYYTSIGGDRTDLGLEPPTVFVIHNMGSGESFFTSMTYDNDPTNQFRLNASARQDQYQIPNFPFQQAEGYRDIDRERDSFLNLSWVHTINSSSLLTVSPFLHYNNPEYIAGQDDPLMANNGRTSIYAGAQSTISCVTRKHNISAGVYGFVQHDSGVFSLADATDSVSVSQAVYGGVGTSYINDQYKPLPWLTIDAGLRYTHFSGAVSENAVNPRIGGSIQLPRCRWILRGFYGTYYQPPPLYTVSGQLFDFSGLSNAIGFLPLHGERDIQREFGITIPWRGWTLDVDHFATSARNFLDHDMLGNSNITLPLTIANARIIGNEAMLHSPVVWRRVRFHAALSNMTAQGLGAVTGGMLEWTPPDGYYFLDHDQRTTLVTGGEVNLPRQYWVSGNIVYGSGFLDMNGPEHLPQHITGDISFGKTWGQHWETGLTVLNIANTRYLLGLDSAFAGTHYNPPREIIGQLKYRFNFRSSK